MIFISLLFTGLFGTSFEISQGIEQYVKTEFLQNPQALGITGSVLRSGTEFGKEVIIQVTDQVLRELNNLGLTLEDAKSLIGN